MSTRTWDVIRQGSKLFAKFIEPIQKKKESFMVACPCQWLLIPALSQSGQEPVQRWRGSLLRTPWIADLPSWPYPKGTRDSRCYRSCAPVVSVPRSWAIPGVLPIVRSLTAARHSVERLIHLPGSRVLAQLEAQGWSLTMEIPCLVQWH